MTLVTTVTVILKKSVKAPSFNITVFNGTDKKKNRLFGNWPFSHEKDLASGVVSGSAFYKFVSTPA